jgi:beta-lactam-binding protein with PASTA domain
VKGKTVDAAKKAIVAAGCTAGRVTKVRSKSVPKGRVLTTRPGPKTRKPGRTKVVLVTAT